MATLTLGGIDVNYIQVRINYSHTLNANANTTTVNAAFQVKHTGTLNSLGVASFRVYIANSSGTVVASGTRTTQTTIPAGSDWTTYASTSYTFTNSSTTGALTYIVGGGTNSTSSDPLNGSGWDTLTAGSVSTNVDNQLYPVVPSFTLTRSSVNLSAGTSSVAFGTSPSRNITTINGTVTSSTGATLTQQYAVSTTSTPGTYVTYTSPTTISPLQRVWVRVTSTADGVTVDRTGASTANITQTIYGYPSKPTSISLSKVGRQVTVTYGNSATNGGYDTSPTYTIQRSSNGGSTWEAHNNSDLLTPAATYIFRVYATNATGDSEARVSDPLFMSAYGYRFDGTYPPVPVNLAKIYVGVGGPGADENGFRTVQNVKRYTESGWVDLQT